MKDTFDRSIRYLRMSVTESCNFACKYCVREDETKQNFKSEIMTLEEVATIAEEAQILGLQKLKLTGGEPLVRVGILDLIERLGALNFEDLSMTTNASLLSKYAKDLKRLGLHRLNISLDTLDEKKFKNITQSGNLQAVMKGIEAAKNEGFYIKINTVLLKHFNDDEIESFAKFAASGIVDELRFIELMKIGDNSNWANSKYLSNETVIERLGLTLISDKQSTSAAVMYKAQNGANIGLISPVSHKFCVNCDRLRVTADGMLRPCLLNDLEFDVKSAVRESREELRKVLQFAILNKPQMHNLESQDQLPKKRNMVRIGG